MLIWIHLRSEVNWELIDEEHRVNENCEIDGDSQIQTDIWEKMTSTGIDNQTVWDFILEELKLDKRW